MVEKKAVSAIMLTLLLIGMLTLTFYVQSVKASGTIYIRADGSIDPPTAPISSVDNVTYILTGNIASDADGIVIERDNITLVGAGYTVQGTGTQSEGILLSGRSNVTVKNTKVTEFDIGLSLIGSNNNTISGNIVTANNAWGIALNHSSSNSVSSNNITNNGYGVWIYLGLNNSVSGNNLTANNWYGIGLIDSSSNVISRNNVINTGNRGITVGSGSNNSISGNTIANNQVGIELGLCYSSCNISGNTIANNGEGIKSEQWSSNNRIYHNNFIGNTKHLGRYFSGTNTWDDGYPSGGNYWSDYAGVDANGDGIGDTPYSFSEIEQDRYPLMSPWGKVPELPSPRFLEPQWLFYAIVAAIAAVVILALGGAVYFQKKRKPPKSSFALSLLGGLMIAVSGFFRGALGGETYVFDIAAAMFILIFLLIVPIFLGATISLSALTNRRALVLILSISSLIYFGLFYSASVSEDMRLWVLPFALAVTGSICGILSGLLIRRKT